MRGAADLNEDDDNNDNGSGDIDNGDQDRDNSSVHDNKLCGLTKEYPATVEEHLFKNAEALLKAAFSLYSSAFFQSRLYLRVLFSSCIIHFHGL